jgi:hypothetical protein
MHKDDADRQREAEETLRRAQRDSESIGSSTLARAADEPRQKPQGWLDHLAARDAVGAADDGGTDPAELWGRRIGRSLSVIGVLVLLFMLGQQLKLW